MCKSIHIKWHSRESSHGRHCGIHKTFEIIQKKNPLHSLKYKNWSISKNKIIQCNKAFWRNVTIQHSHNTNSEILQQQYIIPFVNSFPIRYWFNLKMFVLHTMQWQLSPNHIHVSPQRGNTAFLTDGCYKSLWDSYSMELACRSKDTFSSQN